MEQIGLILETLADPPPKIDDTCTRCGGDRDQILVRLMLTILRLRKRLAELDPSGEIL